MGIRLRLLRINYYYYRTKFSMFIKKITRPFRKKKIDYFDVTVSTNYDLEKAIKDGKRHLFFKGDE